MPRAPQLGFRLYVIAMILTPFAGALDPAPQGADPAAIAPDIWYVLAAAVPLTALKVFLVVFAARRRNWSRIALLIFSGLGLGVFAPQLWRTLVGTPLLGMLELVLALMELVAVVLLFTPAANRWYRGTPSPPVVASP